MSDIDLIKALHCGQKSTVHTGGMSVPHSRTQDSLNPPPAMCLAWSHHHAL